MKDLYSFHLSEDDLNEYYKIVQKAYFRIFKRCDILSSTYLTFASGGSFSKYSHEFQTLCDAGEDIIYICEKCNLAINEEIIKEQEECPNCKAKDLPSKKSIEVGNIFKLKNKFTEPFKLSIANQKGEKTDLIMGCYGIGVGRLMGTIAELHQDKDGLKWPQEIAPFAIHLIGLNLEDDSIKKKADELYQNLLDMNVDVLYDDRLRVTAGEKFGESDKIGCTYRIIASKKTLDKNLLEIKNRLTSQIEVIKISEIANKFKP